MKTNRKCYTGMCIYMYISYLAMITHDAIHGSSKIGSQWRPPENTFVKSSRLIKSQR